MKVRFDCILLTFLDLFCTSFNDAFYFFGSLSFVRAGFCFAFTAFFTLIIQALIEFLIKSSFFSLVCFSSPIDLFQYFFITVISVRQL